MKTITINGKTYPCRVNMAALLRFRRQTGHDVVQISHDDMSDLITLLWCCIVSACAADGVKFGMELMDFADQLDPEALTAFFTSLDQESAPQDPEKKTGQEPTS